jgi:cytoskeletal protein CcmA (bactofilin family)
MTRSMKEKSAMNRFRNCIYGAVGLLAFVSASSCGKDADGNPINPIDAAAGEIAKACGLGCPGDKDADGETVIKGVVDGNVAISGVAQVDAFFGAVNNFRVSADNVSAGIEAQLAMIKADFGIAAETDIDVGLKAQFDANLEGDLRVDYEPARCSVDASATVEASARCEAKVMPGSVKLACKGSCELDASAELKCDASADLECEFTGPTVACQGMCEGSCEAELSATASCSGTCRGTCSGNCSAYSDAAGTQCNGSCSGMCTGSCETKLAAAAKCMGTCRGSCTVSGPTAMCTGAARASCKAKADATVMCEGKCEGEIEPPTASAECKASARAEAKLNVQCTPPRLAASYQLKASANAMAKAKFEGALKTLVQVRLPALLQATARANSIASAGEDLVGAAEGAVRASVRAATDDNLSVRALFGLRCAVNELPKVGDALEVASDRLRENLMVSGDVSKVIKL